MSDAVLSLRGVRRSFGMGDARLEVLKGLDIEVMEGEFLAIMGPSGSGKTTLLNILGCLDRPSAGDYYLDQTNVALLPDHKLSTIRNERIGFIFQSFNLIPQLTVLENVEVPLFYSAKSIASREARCIELLKAVRMDHRLRHRPPQLSGGELQRVAFARALVNNPVLILADEPTGNLDQKTGIEVLDLLSELHREGRTIVMITHDPQVAERAERTIRLVDGQIVEPAAA